MFTDVQVTVQKVYQQDKRQDMLQKEICPSPHQQSLAESNAEHRRGRNYPPTRQQGTHPNPDDSDDY